jgi:outer membrane biosynthesis protein TonB
MRRSVVWSALLHVLVLVLAIVGLPHLWDTTHISDTSMIVEMVKVDEKTAAKDMPKPEPPKKKTPVKKAPAPPERPKTAEIPPPPEPPRIAETPEPKAEKIPVPTPAPPKKKEVKKEKKVEPKPPSPPRAIAKARPKRKPLPPKEDFLQSVLRDVSPEERGEKQEEKKEPLPQPAKKQVQNRAPLDAVATMSEIDAIRHRIEQCWNIPAGAREADKLSVSIRVWVNPDGTVRDARILDQARLSDVFFRTAAESALRAVLNPRCSPLPIPINKYEQFKEMVLDFNPKLATGS